MGASKTGQLVCLNSLGNLIGSKGSGIYKEMPKLGKWNLKLTEESLISAQGSEHGMMTWRSYCTCIIV